MPVPVPASSSDPVPGIDPRGPRFGAAVTAVLLAIVLLLGPTTAGGVLLAVIAALFALGTARGAQGSLQGLLFRCQLLGGPGLLAQAGLQLHRLQVLLKPAQPVQAVECEPATPIHATSSPPGRAARNASMASARLQVSSGRWHSTRSRAGLRSTAKSRAGLLPRWCTPNSTRSREAS